MAIDGAFFHDDASNASIVTGKRLAERLAALERDIEAYGETLRACEAGGVEAFVPEPRRGRRLEQDGRFGLAAFGYDARANAYRCPAGGLLWPMRGGKQDASGKSRIRHASRRSACAACSLRRQCLTAHHSNDLARAPPCHIAASRPEFLPSLAA